MTRRAVRRPRARRDIIEQALYIGRDDPRAAERFQRAVQHAEQMVLDMPGLGAPRSFRHLQNVRMWRVGGFERHLIFYRPTADGIEVLRVLHASRDLAPLLDEDADK
jgi:toxin ParE1/3/4